MNQVNAITIPGMLGATLVKVSGAVGNDEMLLMASDDRVFRFYHSQNCCESVQIEDIIGDLDDLIGSPILVAEEVSNNDPEPYQPSSECWTWTFYRFATAKGSITVRWLGESNGYYSERVDFSVDEPPRCNDHEECKADFAMGRACFLYQNPEGKIAS